MNRLKHLQILLAILLSFSSLLSVSARTSNSNISVHKLAVSHSKSQQSAPSCLPLSGRGDECIPFTLSLRCDESFSYYAYLDCPNYIFTASISGTIANRIPARPAPSEEWFRTDINDPELNRYKYGDETLNSTQLFTIPMSRYYSGLIVGQTDSQGFLDSSVASALVSKDILPEFAELQIAVYDVDRPTSSGCEEYNAVTVNNKSVIAYPAAYGGASVGGDNALYGADNRWTIWRAKVPITHLKFSGEQINYALGVAPPAINQDVRIIRTNCLDKRALAVGWAALAYVSVNGVKRVRALSVI